MKTTGKVWLVGAGPGDPRLLTLKARDAIRQADFILYDYLANPDHLSHAKAEAVKISLGKGFRHRALSQGKINRLLIDAVKKGKNVVRLKGGDPYLFGRGGEEALFLFKRNIPFEVVPGVTSATACAAYAGIPLTHREHNAAVTFLTGHRAHDEKLDTVEWKKIASLGGTLVIYMGFYNLEKIARLLVQNGMGPGTPVAVIEWGTLPRQRSCDGTLENIAQKIRQSNFKPPCIIIVGPVVQLRPKLNWFEKLPLFGKKIIITRSGDKASVLKEKLEALGAAALEAPVIRIDKRPDLPKLDEALRALPQTDWLIFTSSYGVEAFFERLKRKGEDTRSLGGVKIAVVGPETGATLEKWGIQPDLVPTHYETKAILKVFQEKFGRLDGKRFLLFRTNIADKSLETGLKKLGGQTQRVTAYRTLFAKGLSSDIEKRLLAGEIHFVTFTSSSTVTGFIRSLGLKKAREASKKSAFVSIGPVTSKTLRQNGLRIVAQAKTFTTNGLVEAIVSYLRRRSR